ncbi:MAG TPA: helix-hairpin-helix domain-containing protein [Candidatus Binataceae bacterium]|nr:helix-hairpin-helix domain-containing protein [Candidatus Binataceae bacterium]
MKAPNKSAYLLVLLLLLVSAATASPQTSAAKVNVNTASKDELATLPGMSKRKAAKVIAGRPYSSAADLSKSGLSAKQIEKLTPLLTFEGGTAPAAPAVSAAPENAAASPAASATPAHHRSRKAQSTAAASSGGESSSTTAQTPPQPGMVWVNSKTKVYHVEGDRWYGKTKNGKWMTEADAVKAGYRKAK